jgi:hypothetical protein
MFINTSSRQSEPVLSGLVHPHWFLTDTRFAGEIHITLVNSNFWDPTFCGSPGFYDISYRGIHRPQAMKSSAMVGALAAMRPCSLDADGHGWWMDSLLATDMISWWCSDFLEEHHRVSKISNDLVVRLSSVHVGVWCQRVYRKKGKFMCTWPSVHVLGNEWKITK